MPFFNGICSIILISITAGMIVWILKIKNNCFALLIGGLMVSYPVVACTLGYGFTAVYYFLAMFLTVLAIVILEDIPFMSYILISFSLGIYQAYFPIAVLLMILILFRESFQENVDLKIILNKGIKFFLILLVSVITYYIVGKIFCGLLQVDVTEYLGLDSMSMVSISNFKRGLMDMLTIFMGKSSPTITFFEPSMKIAYYVSYIISIALIIYLFISKKTNILLFTLRLIISISIPISILLICVMCTGTPYSLMVYSLVFVFIIPFFLLEQIPERKFKKDRIISYICLVVASFVILYYSMMDNRFYLKEEFLKSQTNSYFTTLVTQIKMLPGYTDDLEIAYINLDNFKDKTLPYIKEFDGITVRPYHRNELITEATMGKYISFWLGYDPTKITDVSAIKEKKEVMQMPSYPDDGSIKIVDNVIVVKF